MTSIIRALELIQLRDDLETADSVELRVSEWAPADDIFVFRPGDAAHWINKEDDGKIVVVVHPDVKKNAQPFLDYLLKDIEHEVTHPSMD